MLIRRLREKTKMTLTELIIVSVLHGQVNVSQTSDKDLLFQLGKIGNNLNQIARCANSQAKQGNPLDLLEINIQLRAIRKEISKYAPDIQENG